MSCANAVSVPAQVTHAMNTTAHELRNVVSVSAQVTHAMNTTDGWMDGWMDGCKQTAVHGPPGVVVVVA